MRSVVVWRKFYIGAFLGLSLFSLQSFAAKIIQCTQSQNKCVAKIEQGVVGDSVRILDEKGRSVGKGFISQIIRGNKAIITIETSQKTLRKNYPAIVEVENRDSQAMWTASFSGVE